MEAGSKNRPTLKVATAAKRLLPALQAIGFKSVKARPRKLVMNLNDETEVFLYPDVRRRWGSVFLDAIIGVENLKLQARLLRSGWERSTRVCHAYLDMLDSWGRLYVDDDEELEQAIQQLVRSVIDVGLPIMGEYDSLDKVRKLFQDDMAHTKRVPVAVLWAREKLERMEEH